MERSKRELNVYRNCSMIRGKYNHITEAKIKIEELNSGTTTGKPVEIRVTGDDSNTLNRLAGQILSDLKTIKGAVDISNPTPLLTGIAPTNLTKNITLYKKSHIII